MRNGAQIALLDGSETLEVVGESFHQPDLWRLAGARPGGDRVLKDICAVLVAEDDNPYDADAVAVWIDGLQVGHLSRENAQLYRPGLLAQQEAQGMPIALAGVIAGGGIRSDGPGMLGVFLHHDPEDFGLPRPRFAPPPESRMRTGLSDALATDAADDSYDLAWMTGLPSDDIRAIPYLRNLLAHEKDLLDRHFMFAQLETILYRCRSAFTSALGEYDEACRQHDAEMDGIRQACLDKWGKVPLLETYRQMAIRQQKADNYSQALWWAERGIALYGHDCARPEAVEDLRSRAAKYQAKLADQGRPEFAQARPTARSVSRAEGRRRTHRGHTTQITDPLNHPTSRTLRVLRMTASARRHCIRPRRRIGSPDPTPRLQGGRSGRSDRSPRQR